MYNDPNQPSPPNGSPYGPPQQQPTRYTGPYGPSPQQPTQPPAPYGGPPITPFDQVQYAPTHYTQPPQVAPTPAPLPPASPNASAPSRLRSSRRGLWITLGAVVTGIVIAVIAFFVLQVVFNGATARMAIDDYYQAIMQQDYNKAYSYFDTARMTAKEATAGQTIFVKAQQIVDTTYGPVTTYTITSATQLDDQDATVAVDFTRKGKVYHAQYSMKKVNGSWKIEQAQQ